MNLPPTLHRSRTVERLIAGRPTTDGAGVKLVRLLTHDLQRRLDPFLMLDAFGTDNPGDSIGGFPDHPHRGFETVTTLREGRMRHRDSAGHEGLLEPGGVQWMTAGRGVIHSEMPEPSEGRMAGFQLWLNLPARDKMCAPDYRDFPAAAIPQATAPGATVGVIAGAALGVVGAMQRDVTQPLFLDITMQTGAHVDLSLPTRHNAFLYVDQGTVDVVGTSVPAGRMAILANDPVADGVVLRAGPAGGRAILVAGAPLNEPIVQHGPFVMNTHEQIVQAVQDFRRGVLA